jgi:hypothetical protein
MFARLKTLGIDRKWWLSQDFKLYATYWRLAPKQGWSRFPLVAFCLLVAVAFIAFFLSFRHLKSK